MPVINLAKILTADSSHRAGNYVGALRLVMVSPGTPLYDDNSEPAGLSCSDTFGFIQEMGYARGSIGFNNCFFTSLYITPVPIIFRSRAPDAARQQKRTCEKIWLRVIRIRMITVKTRPEYMAGIVSKEGNYPLDRSYRKKRIFFGAEQGEGQASALSGKSSRIIDEGEENGTDRSGFQAR